MYSTITVPSSIHSYTIEFVDTLSSVEDLMREPNTISVIDSTVATLYPRLSNGIVIEATEKAKTLQGAESLLDMLATKKANVKTKLVAVGGGIIQDLVGFCASVYARGIEYSLVPTTLLAQGDSCVGGKTSINLNHKKNLVGTFYPPAKILIYPEFLKTLSKTDYISGLGELYKFSILQGTTKTFDSKGDILKMIYEALSYKISILTKDEFDKGDRRFLNYGHTFGHALESTSHNEIPHGLAVILGSMIASRVANELGYDAPDYYITLAKGINLIRESNLKLKAKWFDLENLLEAVKSDKKSTGQLTMVLVDNKPFLENVENLLIIKKAIKETYESI
jgi:3-dehydroquinate synthase